MTISAPLTALRVANEAFLVASTIERCPKTMMLRELVMNALEAADRAAPGGKAVRIMTRPAEGVGKLAIWNTGPGMSAAELHQICDLASSLRKETGLDRNFGMGAKVASLPSNKLGVRYRSCRAGVASEVRLVQRDGVYGRHRYSDAAGPDGEVADVSDACRAEGYDLSLDWTEVVLFGNWPGQETLADPYNNDPAMPPHWLESYLSRRFFRLPPGVSVTLPDGTAFRGIAGRLGRFDRHERVAAPGGIFIHYGYATYVLDDPGRAAPDGLPDFVGLAGVVHRGELYALREGADWILEAPLYGFPFAARHCSVFVELPDQYGVRAEVYRQFLRFQGGDQRQVYLQDFAAAVHDARPGWLREIIASYSPPQADYLGEVTSEVRDLLAELGVVAEHGQTAAAPRGARRPDDAAAAEAAAAPQPQPQSQPQPPSSRPPGAPARPAFEAPPDIIALHDPAMVEERDLLGRAARYYAPSHQLFVNMTYPAVARLRAQLEQEFESVRDAPRRAEVALELAEWVVTRQVARALAFSLAKKAAGWKPEEIARAQAPEALSIAADDTLAQLGAARRRMAEMLGVAPPGAPEAVAAGGAGWSLKVTGELAEAQQAARKALTSPNANAGPVLRRVSTLEAQRGNLAEAIEWARKALAAEPGDLDSHSHLAELLLRQGRLDEADEVCGNAIALSGGNPCRFLLQRSSIVAQRGDLPGAIAVARQALAADPDSTWAWLHLASQLSWFGDLDGAEQAARQGLALGQGNAGRFLRQLSVVAAQRGDTAAALAEARRAVEADPQDVAGLAHLGELLTRQREFDDAERVVRRALELKAGNPAGLLRQLSVIEAQRGALQTAIDLAEQAIDSDPADTSGYHHLSGLLLRLGRLDDAEAAVRKGLDRTPPNPALLLRQQSVIAARRGDLAAAAELAQRSAEADPRDVWGHYHLSSLLLRQGELDRAEQVMLRGLELKSGNPAPHLRQLSEIAARRGDADAALDLARRSVAADPTDAWGHHHLASLLQARDELDAAEAAAREALRLSGDEPGVFQQRLEGILAQRRRAAA